MNERALSTNGSVKGKSTESWQRQLLRGLNLRPEESERTFLMFAFYTLTSIGVLWLEVSVAALFLGEYGAESLPWIYIASAGIGAGLGGVYSWLQRIMPLHRVIVLTAALMAVPLFLFRVGLNPAVTGGYIIFLMRLWMEAIYVINELNTSITANQLFTIREIKRTYPLISSGILAADVLSGLSLPLLRGLVGLQNVILLASLLLLGGAAILLYLTKAYRQFFPEVIRRRTQEKQQDFTARQLDKPQRQYVILVFAFFIMVQVLALLLDFQYLNQLEQGMSVDKIADFLALFSAILGTVELATQWFVSGRVIEKLGLFVIAALPPILLAVLSTLTLTGLVSLFVGVLILKFVDELLRYTFVASTGPILFQPIPDSNRSRVQSIVRGIAEPLCSGLTGVAMLGTIWLFQHLSANSTQDFEHTQSLVFLVYTAVFALFWLFTVLKLRSKYLEVLVLSSERGQLSLSNVDLSALKRSLVEALGRAQTDAERKSCIELLTEVDPQHIGDILAPLLPTFSPALQQQSLEVMLNSPNPAHLDQVRSLLEHPLSADVLAVALRYLWMTDPDPNLQELQSYLKPHIDPVVRSTAAALMLRRGDPLQKAEATDTLRRMLTSKQERERVMGCRALSDAIYLQYLRLFISPLLQDESLRVRCAMLEAIAATHLEEYYPVLLRGLYYKSTREAARHALVRLGDEAIPLLVEFAEDVTKPEGIRAQAWMTIGQIATPEAIDLLVTRLLSSWGDTRRTLLRVLLKVHDELGIEAVSNDLGRRGIENLITQELQFLAHIYASLLDLTTADLTSADRPVEATTLLIRSLRDSEADAIERIFLLMRFLYDSNSIQAAAFSIQTDSRDSVARGLEILDNTIDLPHKAILLNILDQQVDAEKVQNLRDLIPYEAMSAKQRLRYLVDLRHFLSDWALACCFHLARQMRWSLNPDQILACLASPTGFVREAVLSYLQVASPRTLYQVLPSLKNDPDRLVATQVEQLMAEIAGKRPKP